MPTLSSDRLLKVATPPTAATLVVPASVEEPGLAPSAMVTRLIHSGLPLENLRTVRGHCDACGLDNDLALYGKDMAACLVCGTSQPRPIGA